MSHSGDYLNSTGQLFKEKKLLFWGEYECRSEYKIIGAKHASGHSSFNPIAVHTPLYPNASTHGLNTDPFIFGDKFYYHCCKIGKIERLLKKGDIVLFGTVFKSGSGQSQFEFHLDTLLVVDERIEDIKTLNHVLFERCNRETTRAWSGLMYSQSPDLFSFVPCKDDNGLGFGRPIIDVVSLGFITQISSCRYNPGSIAIDNAYIFNEIKDKVIKQGFCLGVRFDEPKKTAPCKI